MPDQEDWKGIVFRLARWTEKEIEWEKFKEKGENLFQQAMDKNAISLG